MPRLLPPDPDLDQLRRQARELLRAYRAGDVAARQRVAALAPYVLERGRAQLADALFVLAREHGFASWPALKRYIAALPARPAPTPKPPTQRVRAARLTEHLAKLVDQQAIAAVLAALAVPRRDFAPLREALIARGAYGRLVDLLIAGAGDPNARIRFGAAQAMDHFADERCAAVLERLLRDPVPRVRWAAIHSLACDTCKLAPLAPAGDLAAMLIDMALSDSSISVRRVAAYELGGFCGDARVAAALEQLLASESDPELVRNARAARRRQLGS